MECSPLGRPINAAGAMRKDFRHLLDLGHLIPFTSQRDNVADADISHIQAVNDTRQGLDIDLLANDAIALPSPEPLHPRAPDMLAPKPGDRLSELIVLRQLDQQRSRDRR